MVLEHIGDALSCLASCLVVDLRSSSSLQCITKQVLALLLLRSSVVEEAVDVGVTVKVKTDSYGVNFFEGSIVRIAPNGKRAFKNTGSSEMLVLCVQDKANSFSDDDEPLKDAQVQDRTAIFGVRYRP